MQLICGTGELVYLPELKWPSYVVQERAEVEPIVLR